MNFCQSLSNLIEKRGISRNQLAKELNISEGTIRSWYKNSQPTLDKLIKLSQYFSVSLDELAGHCNCNNSFTFEEKHIIEEYNLLSDEEKFKIASYMEISNMNRHSCITPASCGTVPQTSMAADESTCRYNTCRYDKKLVPVRGYVAAGKPIMALDNHLTDITVMDERIDYALIVNGNSMDPLIQDGAYVYVQSCDHLENGEIGVFLIDSDVTCKKFFQNDVIVKLISINPAYEDMIFLLNDPKNEHLNFKIEGRVILL